MQYNHKKEAGAQQKKNNKTINLDLAIDSGFRLFLNALEEQRSSS